MSIDGGHADDDSNSRNDSTFKEDLPTLETDVYDVENIELMSERDSQGSD